VSGIKVKLLGIFAVRIILFAIIMVERCDDRWAQSWL